MVSLLNHVGRPPETHFDYSGADSIYVTWFALDPADAMRPTCCRFPASSEFWPTESRAATDQLLLYSSIACRRAATHEPWRSFPMD